MQKELTYEEYNKLYKKYHITARSQEKTIKEKFIKALIELPEIDSDLLNSRIMDCFFENGERVTKICAKLLLEEANYSFYFENILNKYFNKDYLIKKAV